MLRLVANLLLGGASSACGFAAVAVALYAGNPAQAAAAVLFASVGLVAGLLCGGLHAVFDGLPVQPVAAMRPEALASLVRATLASAVAERAPRSGSAADRQPTPAQWAAAALADAAATSPGNASADTLATTLASTLADAPADALADALTAAARSTPPTDFGAPVAPALPVAAPQPVDPRRFARSEFGA